jgi:hypothetical protein
VRSYVLNTGTYNVTAANSTAYVPGAGASGTLGQASPFFMGSYDFKPWQGPPPENQGDWNQTTQSVPTGKASARFNLNQTVNPTAGAGGRIAPLQNTDFMRNFAICTLASGWDYFPGNFGQLSTASPAALAGAQAGVINIGVGPDIMSGFFNSPVVEIDLDPLIGGSRFGAFWIWAVWLGYNLAATETVTVRTTVESGQAAGPQNDTLAVSVPIPVIGAGPWGLGNESVLSAIAKTGPMHRARNMRATIANGGDAIAGSVIQYSGMVPVANTAFAAPAGAAATFGAGVPPLGNPIIDGIDHMVMYSQSTLGTPAGPCIATFCGS